MAQGYDPAKAEEVNKLIAQGQTPRDALLQAGITQDEFGNYFYNPETSVLGPRIGPATTEQSVVPSSDPSQFPAYDDDGNLQPGFAINDETGQAYYRGFPSQDTRNTPVNPSADPSQFPAYDDDGNLMPGFAINDETGQTYYRGVGPLTQQTSGFDPNYNEFAGLDEAIAAQQTATPVNNPYYGLTPQQLQALGGADPTDPYIRARLGIPQLPGSTLFATGGFGTLKTGVPLIDTALGIVGGIASGIGSVFSNFASTIGGLFGPKPTASTAAATTGAGFAAATVPVTTPPKKDTPVTPTADPSQFPAYDDDGNLQPGFAINEETGQTYYRGFPSQDATDTPVNPASDPSQFPAYDDDGNLQPGFAINDETGQTYYRGFPSQDARDTPLSPTADPSQFPAYDDDGNLQPGFAINEETGDTYYRGFERNTDQPLSPTADPSQFPAYDDDGNLMPGYAINDETGETYYQGYERSYDEAVNPEEDPFEQSRYEAELAYDAQEPYEFGAADINDPYYGLSAQQLQDLGGADPTDPYIRARLGIPQLPGSTLLATPGFGTIKTGIPLIDSALNFLGNLFGGPPTKNTAVSTQAATTGSGFAGAAEAVTGPGTTDTPVNPASDPSQFPPYDDDGNLQPGWAINEETGQPYYQGFEKNTDEAVNPASDPSQFPAYDDEGNLQPGWSINEETGEPYYQGFEKNTDEAVNPASDPSQFPAYDDEGNLQPGFAINEETGEPYYQGFEKNTDQPLDITSDPSQFPAYDDDGNLQPGFAINEETGEPYYIGDERNTDQPVDVTSDPSQFPAYDDEGNLQPGFAINDETGQPYYIGDERSTDEPVDPAEDPAYDEFAGLDEAVAIQQADIDANNDPLLTEDEVQAELDRTIENDAAEDVNPDEDESLQLPPGADPEDVENEEPYALNPDEDEGLQLPPGADPEDVENEEPYALNPDDDEGLPQEGEAETPDGETDPDAAEAASQNATVQKAQEQATLQARYKQPGVTDWRVRLVLSENSDYLYKASDADILKPLAASNGVIFPYTPNITTSYVANYEQYNLIHSNYRGLFYKSSNVGDVQIRGTFTAQDTQEAAYLLAVIHFFRSVTKMFYGKDAQRGTPPPLVYLVGYGDWQFSGHPCVVSAFNYNLPNEVDYIRASSPNNYGTNLLNRRTPIAASPGGINYAGAIRLANALLPKGALPQVPSPGAVPQSVANTNRASYVPTKMEIDITLIPVQTREQVSKQFSLKAFANGNLLKGGYW